MKTLTKTFQSYDPLTLTSIQHYELVCPRHFKSVHFVISSDEFIAAEKDVTLIYRKAAEAMRLYCQGCVSERAKEGPSLPEKWAGWPEGAEL